MNDSARAELEAYWAEFNAFRERVNRVAGRGGPFTEDDLEALAAAEDEIAAWNEVFRSRE